MPEDAAAGSFEFMTPVQPLPYANTVPGEAWWPAGLAGVGSAARFESGGTTPTLPLLERLAQSI